LTSLAPCLGGFFYALKMKKRILFEDLNGYELEFIEIHSELIMRIWHNGDCNYMLQFDDYDQMNAIVEALEDKVAEIQGGKSF
jgi:hypothetical protein